MDEYDIARKLSAVGIKLIVYGRGSGWSWTVGVVNGTFRLTCFLLSHSTICVEVYIHKQVASSNTMKEHPRTWIGATYFP